jgi:hypothetical protein
MKQHTWPLLLAAALVAGCTKTAAPPAAPVTATPPAAAITTHNPTKESLNEAALAQIQAQNWAEAIRLAQQAVALDVNFAPARYNLGLALYRAQRYQEAAPHLEMAYRLNPAQVEPGWFLYLTLDALGSPKAATVLADLEARFPENQDVKRAAGAGALVWPRAQDEQVLLFLGDRELLARPGGVLELRGHPDRKLWTLRLPDDVAGVVPDQTGARALAIMPGSAVLIDLTAGINLGRAPAEVAAAFRDKYRVVWRGDLIYTGIDLWGGGGKYAGTDWRIQRLVSGGQQITWQPVGVSFVAGQQLFVSKDGHTAFGQTLPGAPFILFRDGKVERSFERATGMNVAGDAIYSFGSQHEFTVTSLEGKPLAGWRAPAGMADFRAWDGPDTTWFVAAAPLTDPGYIVVTDHGQVAFQGPGAPVGSSPGYLFVRQGTQLQVVDGTGKVRLTFPGVAAAATPDGRWVYTTSLSDFRAYRLP